MWNTQGVQVRDFFAPTLLIVFGILIPNAILKISHGLGNRSWSYFSTYRFFYLLIFWKHFTEHTWGNDSLDSDIQIGSLYVALSACWHLAGDSHINKSVLAKGPSWPLSVQPYFGTDFAFCTNSPKFWTNSLLVIYMAHWLKSSAYVLWGEETDNKRRENHSILDGDGCCGEK